MAYNNGFPIGYQQMYYPQPQQFQPVMQTPPQTPQNAPQTAPQATSGIIWVQGEAGAKSYLVAPNTTVQLWDSEQQTIYLKSADASGMPSMKTLDYTIRDQAPANIPVAAPQPAAPDYVTKADIEALSGQIAAIKADIENMSTKKVTIRQKKEEDENG